MTAGPSGLLHVERCMGTVFSIAVRDPGGWEDPVREVVGWLHRVDALFSTYRADSQISRLRRGELAVQRADPLVREVLELCDHFEQQTGGAFSAHLPGGLDPTGLVKGWAIERGSDILRRHGSRHHSVNGGGDLQLAGEASPGQGWRVGITDPHDAATVVAVVQGRDFAVATSGTSERGAHILDPRTARPACELSSVTVVGASLTQVDVYATAAFAMGQRAVAWLQGRSDVESLVISPDRTTFRTSRFETPVEDWLPRHRGRDGPR